MTIRCFLMGSDASFSTAPISSPQVILVMGVSGSGKSTLARSLADKLHARYLDADDFHPPANIEKMRDGQPLTDDDRAAWLDALNRVLNTGTAERVDQVLACSALKESYRRQLRQGLPSFRIVFLHGSRAELERRLLHRSNHFMPAALLDSQLETLEEPTGPDVIRLPLALPLAHAVDAVADALAAL